MTGLVGIHLDLAHVLPYREKLRDVCAEQGFDPFVLAGLGLRESGLGTCAGYAPKGPLGWGDQGHAFGLFQIDKRFHAPFLATPASQTVEGQARYALALLQGNAASLGHLVPGLAPARALEATLCGYNASLTRVVNLVRSGQDPNLATTGKDYGRWVVAKAAELREACPTLFDVLATVEV